MHRPPMNQPNVQQLQQRITALEQKLQSLERVLQVRGSDLQINAGSFVVNAQSEVTIKGGASAELSASGQTTVKGAMVMIN